MRPIPWQICTWHGCGFAEGSAVISLEVKVAVEGEAKAAVEAETIAAVVALAGRPSTNADATLPPPLKPPHTGGALLGSSTSWWRAGVIVANVGCGLAGVLSSGRRIGVAPPPKESSPKLGSSAKFCGSVCDGPWWQPRVWCSSRLSYWYWCECWCWFSEWERA